MTLGAVLIGAEAGGAVKNPTASSVLAPMR